MAAGLLFVFEAKLGPPAWTWFDEEKAKASTEGFKWDNLEGIVDADDGDSNGWDMSLDNMGTKASSSMTTLVSSRE
jgi:hypothetical protein